jgi:hypothetical protein
MADRGHRMADKRKPDDPQQSKRFIDTAREAEADETEKGAERAFKKVVPSNTPTLLPGSAPANSESPSESVGGAVILDQANALARAW